MKSVEAESSARKWRTWGKLLLTCLVLPIVVLVPLAWMMSCAEKVTNPLFTGALLLGTAGFLLPTLRIADGMMKNFLARRM